MKIMCYQVPSKHPYTPCSGTRRHKRAVAHPFLHHSSEGVPYRRVSRRHVDAVVLTASDYMNGEQNCNGTLPSRNFKHKQQSIQSKMQILQLCPLNSRGTPETD
jgi:hypothetical protein